MITMIPLIYVPKLRAAAGLPPSLPLTRRIPITEARIPMAEMISSKSTDIEVYGGLGQSVEVVAADIKSRLAERRIQLEFDQSAVDFIARNGFDRDFGARPVKRAVQNYVENPLAKLILAGKFSDECKIKVLARGDTLDFVEEA